MAQKKKDDKWMQSAVKKEGSFTAYMKRRYGSAAFTRDGSLKKTYIRKVINDPNVRSTTKKRAQLALTFKETKK